MPEPGTPLACPQCDRTCGTDRAFVTIARGSIMVIGILAGLATCALWGLTFVAPRAVAPVPAVDLVIVRYVVFGLLSLGLMLHPRMRPTGLGRRRMATGLLLGAIGYVAYFMAVALAVEWAGATLPPLVIGIMPVTLALIGNLRERTVPWRRLAWPLSAISAGLVVVDVAAFRAAAPGTSSTIVAGLVAAVAALAIWTLYGAVNATIMRADDAPGALAWTGVQGIGAGLASMLLLPFSSLGALRHADPGIVAVFLGWALFMGIVASYVAGLLWTVASRRLPLALAAQLIVAETAFGLLFGFLFDGRWPSFAEWVGCGLQIVGVVTAIAVFVRPRPRMSGEAGPP